MGERREAVYRFIAEFIAERGYSPTYREIAEGVGLKSPSTVLKHLKSLKSEGRVDYVSTGPRTVHPVDRRVSS